MSRIEEHYIKRKMLSENISKLAQNKDKTDFLKLICNLDKIFSQYNNSLINARVRPTTRNIEVPAELYTQYLALRQNITTTLSIAVLFK